MKTENWHLVLTVLLIITVIILILRVNQISSITDKIFEEQQEKIVKEKDRVKRQQDSLFLLIQSQQTIIHELDSVLIFNLNKSKVNNLQYEELKKQIAAINDADSLATILTNRYKR